MDKGGKGFVAFIWPLLVNLFEGSKGVVFRINFSCLDEFVEFGIIAPFLIAFLLLYGSLSAGRHDRLPNYMHCIVMLVSKTGARFMLVSISFFLNGIDGTEIASCALSHPTNWSNYGMWPRHISNHVHFLKSRLFWNTTADYWKMDDF